MRIGFAMKDTMSARALLPLAKECARQGHGVTLFVEGAARKEIVEFGTVIAVGSEKEPEKDAPHPDSYWSSGVEGLHCLVVGTSKPIHAEQLLALAANRAEVPVIAYPDTWGAEGRLGSDVKIDTWFAIDDNHATLIGNRAVVIGDPAYEMITTAAKHGARERLESCGDREQMLLVVGQGFEYLTDVVEAAIDIALLSNCKLVLKLWHPKKVPEQAILDRVTSMLRPLHERVVTIGTEDEKLLDTDTLAKLCGVTISVFTTVLRIAAGAGNRAISVHSSATMEGMKKSTSLDFYPPASSEGPIYRLEYDPRAPFFDELTAIPRGVYKPVPVDVQKAVGTIVNLVV